MVYFRLLATLRLVYYQHKSVVVFPSETNGLSGMAIPLRLIEQLYAFFKEFPSVLALNTSMKWKMESYRIQMVNTCLFSMLEQHVFKPIEWQLRVEKSGLLSDESMVHPGMDNYRGRGLKFICLTVGWIGWQPPHFH